LVFNPREPEAAEYFSSLLEDEEIMYKQKSVSRNDGKRSISTSEQRQTKKLFDGDALIFGTEGGAVLGEGLF
jgi:type IV secretory pathway TraG/TraD family ATPase VirD4